jgi:hypothetical protein
MNNLDDLIKPIDTTKEENFAVSYVAKQIHTGHAFSTSEAESACRKAGCHGSFAMHGVLHWVKLGQLKLKKQPRGDFYWVPTKQASVFRVAQAQATSEDSLLEQIALLPVVSYKAFPDQELSEHPVRNPANYYGVEDVVDGMNYSSEIEIVLEGDIPEEKSLITNDSLQKTLDESVEAYKAEFNNGVFKIVEDEGENMAVEKVQAKLVSLSVNPSGSYHVSVKVNVSMAGFKSKT